MTLPSGISCGLIPLRRNRLGPPDVYPQEPNQKEDDLSLIHVKQGFTLSYSSLVSDEYGSVLSSKFANISSAKVFSDFKAIASKKEELNTLPDTGRRRQPINIKDNFWLVTGRNKSAVDSWFSDLANNTKTRVALLRKFPIFNKKEEIMNTLCEHQVPALRAVWFIKVSAAYAIAISEANKTKKRQLADSTPEWTLAMISYCREQLKQILEVMNQNSAFPSSVEDCLLFENSLPLRQWDYCIELCEYMYNDGLLDRQEFLQWILDLMEKCRNPEDNILRFCLPLILQFSPQFCQSELLSRKLAFQCAKKISYLVNDTDAISKTTNNRCHPVIAAFNELTEDSYTRFPILTYSCIFQCITLECPTSLVWHYYGDNMTPSSLLGSPLDLLPSCCPSALPMPNRPNNAAIRRSLREAEEAIKQRSISVEAKWSGASGDPQFYLVNRMLETLEELDMYVFERSDSSYNCLDALYTRLFGDSKFLNENDTATVHTLCEWAITVKRSGLHRAFVVAKLLEQRQISINKSLPVTCKSGSEEDLPDVRERAVMEEDVVCGPTVFQDVLFDYLHRDAPTLGDDKEKFRNLVLLFYQLICFDVFSHDAYLCRLISMGEREIAQRISKPIKTEDCSSFEDSKVNDDIANLLSQIKEGNQLRDDESSSFVPSSNNRFQHEADIASRSRHWQYAYHFPLPPEDGPFSGCSPHDANQRHVLIYSSWSLNDGSGSEENARNVSKRVNKDMNKLFTKRCSVSLNGNVKKYCSSVFSGGIVAFVERRLSYFDQHLVTTGMAAMALEMLMAFASGNGQHLPLPQSISFLFELASIALNIQGLLEWCLLILKELPAVESRLSLELMDDRNSTLKYTYCTDVTLRIVGTLRRYHSILILSTEDVQLTYEYLSKLVVQTPYNSNQWFTLAYLYDLCCSCPLLKTRDPEKFTELKQLFASPVEPSLSSYSLTDNGFTTEFIRLGSDNQQALSMLVDSPQNRYNLVYNVLTEVCGCSDFDRLNDLAITCCQWTSKCSSLASEWLAALTALCNAGSPNSYVDLLSSINVSDPNVYSRLSVFVCILIARHCFQLQSFVCSVAIPSLIKAWEEVKETELCHQRRIDEVETAPLDEWSMRICSEEAESGARLSCHLLLRLFQSITGESCNRETNTEIPKTLVDVPFNSLPPNWNEWKHPSGMRNQFDRASLASAHRNITVGAIIAVLKAILVLGDASTNVVKQYKKSCFKRDALSDGLDPIPMECNTDHLSDFVKSMLNSICSQQWIRDRCLQVPDDLLKNGTLLDPMLSSAQAQKLLRLMCCRQRDDEMDVFDKRHVSKMLEDLDRWKLRVCIVEVKLIFHQLQMTTAIGANGANPSANLNEISRWLDEVAQVIVDFFGEDKNSDIVKHLDGGLKVKNKSKRSQEAVWVIPHLLKHLKFLQSRVLKACGVVLENGSGHITPTIMLSGHVELGYHPFLQLVTMCLHELDADSKDKKDRLDRQEQKENMLQSLHTQLSTFLCFNKNENIYDYADSKARRHMLDSLQLRFALVGGLFDSICGSITSITDWSTLLVQLIARGVVDLTNNSILFTDLLDMLTSLIHSTLVVDRESGQLEETRKHAYAYHALVKKLKKEIGDRDSPSITYLRQLLPIPKKWIEVIVTEPFGTITDAKGNKVKGFNSDKKQGYQVCEKQKINPWDILEGHKNPAPLSWAWFGAVKHERKPNRYEKAFHEMKYTSNKFEKPTSYFLEPPPLPSEDLELLPSKTATSISASSSATIMAPEIYRHNAPLQNTCNMTPAMMNMTPGGQIIGYPNNGVMMGSPRVGPAAMMGMMRGNVGAMGAMHGNMQPNVSVNQRQMQMMQMHLPHSSSSSFGKRGNSKSAVAQRGGRVAAAAANSGSLRMMTPVTMGWPNQSAGQYNNMQPATGFMVGSQFGVNSNVPSGPTRFGSSGQQPPQSVMHGGGTNSKQALQNMLRARHPNPQYMNTGGPRNSSQQFINQQQFSMKAPNMRAQQVTGGVGNSGQPTAVIGNMFQANNTTGGSAQSPAGSYSGVGGQFNNFSVPNASSVTGTGQIPNQQQYIMRASGGYHGQQVMMMPSNSGGPGIRQNSVQQRKQSPQQNPSVAMFTANRTQFGSPMNSGGVNDNMEMYQRQMQANVPSMQQQRMQQYQQQQQQQGATPVGGGTPQMLGANQLQRQATGTATGHQHYMQQGNIRFG